MKISTAGLSAGERVEVVSGNPGSLPPVLTVMDSNGALHHVLEGDLVPLHDYCEHEYGWCIA